MGNFKDLLNKHISNAKHDNNQNKQIILTELIL